MTKLKSVGSMVKTLSQPFDRHEKSLAGAAKEGTTQAEILLKWDRNRMASIKKGADVHEHIRKVLSGEPLDSDDAFLAHNPPSSAVNEIATFDKLWENLKKDLTPVEIEMKFNALGLTGVVDVIFEDNSGDLSLVDWKTGKFDAFSPFGNLKDPFCELSDSKLNQTKLQLALYKIALLDLGYNISRCYAVRIGPRSHEIYRCDNASLLERVRVWAGLP